MKNTLGNFIVFAAGAVIGSAVTWKIVKTKYEQIAREEINSVKETFAKRHPRPVKDESESKRYLKEVAEPFAEGFAKGVADGLANESSADQLDIRAYADKLRDLEYVNYSNHNSAGGYSKQKDDDGKTTASRIIRPEEFGESDDYESISLTYYSDGVLTYEDDTTIVEDADEIIGIDPSEHFGEYEDDSVFIRNDELKCDYEILYDPRKFSDVVNDR